MIASFQQGERKGTYWGIRTNIDNYGVEGALKASHDQTILLANTPTRLKRLDAAHQERLINWGYAVCDAAIRKHLLDQAPRPTGFPFPHSGV